MPQAWLTFLWAVSPITLCCTSQAPSGGMKSIGALSIDVQLESSVGSGWATHSHSFTRLSWSHSWYPGCVPWSRRPYPEMNHQISNCSRMLLKNILAAWCNRLCFKHWPGDERRPVSSKYDASQSLSHLTGELCFSWSVNPSGKLEGRFLSTLDLFTQRGNRKNWVVQARGQETMCFALDVLVFANVLPVVTDTFFSRVQNGIDIWFHALQYTALICPATYILNLWHKDYLRGELLCCISSFLILSRCEPSGGCG